MGVGRQGRKMQLMHVYGAYCFGNSRVFPSDIAILSDHRCGKIGAHEKGREPLRAWLTPPLGKLIHGCAQEKQSGSSEWGLASARVPLWTPTSAGGQHAQGHCHGQRAQAALSLGTGF